MLPTFVIGLREGLEAALIVGIVAAFLRQRGRLDLLRWALAGVGAAITLCLAIGIALDIVSHDLPQRQQEGLETVVGAVAVCMVTYMVVWMRRHARTLKAQLEGAADQALAAGSGFALVVMAFLAVLREGFETVVFLLAAFNQNGNTSLAALGALLGIIVAIGLGWGIYRGGVRLNLAKFFRFTGIVLTFVAAGLVVSALHTAHEAGWLTAGQQSTVDLSAFVRPGSVQAALLTGMLGLQPRPVLIEVIGWLVYLVPVGLYVAIPPARNGVSRISRRTVQPTLIAVGALAVIAAVILGVSQPDHPTANPVTRGADGVSAHVVTRTGNTAVIAATVLHPGGSAADAVTALNATAHGQQQVDGVPADVYHVTVTGPVPGGPTTMTYAQLAAKNGGRLPLGVRAGDGTDVAPVQTAYSDEGTFLVEPRTGRVIDAQWRETTTLTAQFSIGTTVVGSPQTANWQLPAATVASAVVAARSDRHDLDRRAAFGALAISSAVIAGLCLAALAGLSFAGRRPRPAVARADSAEAATPAITGELATSVSSDVRPITPRSALLKS